MGAFAALFGVASFFIGGGLAMLFTGCGYMSGTFAIGGAVGLVAVPITTLLACAACNKCNTKPVASATLSDPLLQNEQGTLNSNNTDNVSLAGKNTSSSDSMLTTVHVDEGRSLKEQGNADAQTQNADFSKGAKLYGHFYRPIVTAPVATTTIEPTLTN